MNGTPRVRHPPLLRLPCRLYCLKPTSRLRRPWNLYIRRRACPRFHRRIITSHHFKLPVYSLPARDHFDQSLLLSSTSSTPCVLAFHHPAIENSCLVRISQHHNHACSASLSPPSLPWTPSQPASSSPAQPWLKGVGFMSTAFVLGSTVPFHQSRSLVASDKGTRFHIEIRKLGNLQGKEPRLESYGMIFRHVDCQVTPRRG